MQYIIDFVNGTSESEINDYLSACGATVIKSFNAFDQVLLVETDSIPPSTGIVESIIDDLDHTNNIKLLSTVSLELPTMPTENSKTVVINDQKDWWKVYSGSVVDLDSESFTLPLSGKGSVVYLLDSGIKSDHPDFEGADIEYLYSITEDYADTKGHGTALASLIVGKTCGITNAKLKVVKLFDSSVGTKLSDFLSALDAVYNDYATFSKTPGIMNCSWAVERNEYIEAKMQKLYMAGVKIVTAAGNNGTDIGSVTPAAMPEAIVLGSYNSSLLPSDFSDYTGPISVTQGPTNTGQLSGWAPGENIYVATLDGGYAFAAGTSMSAAIHSAIMAYNVTLPVFEFDHEFGDVWGDSTKNSMTYLIKPNLLLLDDPKYANCPNMVSYLVTDVTDPYKYVGFHTTMLSVAYAGKMSITTMFNPATFASVTLSQPLPYNFSINKYGILTGFVETIESDEVYTIPVSILELDGSTTDADLQIKIIKELNPQAPTDSSVNLPYDLRGWCGENLCSGYPDIQVCGGFACTYGGYCLCSEAKAVCMCI